MAVTLASPSRASAKRTVNNLVLTHRATLAAIQQGQRFYKRGEDITEALYKRVLFEIDQCHMVLQALDSMKDGDVHRAAGLCEQIQEHILNVQ